MDDSELFSVRYRAMMCSPYCSGAPWHHSQLNTNALTVLGDYLLQKVLDARLGESARESLIRSVVFEDLRAFREKRYGAVPCARLSQMLRFADEEIRTCAARAVPDLPR